jgi:hypothetical protein
MPPGSGCFAPDLPAALAGVKPRFVTRRGKSGPPDLQLIDRQAKGRAGTQWRGRVSHRIGGAPAHRAYQLAIG